MKSFMASPATIERKWYVVDADGCDIRTFSIRSGKGIKRKKQTERSHRTLIQAIM